MKTSIEIEDYGAIMHPRYGVKILINGEAIPDVQVDDLSNDPAQLVTQATERLTAFLAEKPEVLMGAKHDDHSYRGTFLFVRRDGFEITNAAVLTLAGLGSLGPHPRRETFDRWERAVTWWLRNTQRGREAWEESVEDFNIGDMLNDGVTDDIEFQNCCHRLGVRVELCEQIPFESTCAYDRNLNLERHLDE